MKTSIDMENLKYLTTNIKNKKNTINDELKKILIVLNQNEKEYKKIGLNMSEEVETIKKCFKDIDDRLEMLISVVDIDVINAYKQLSEGLRHTFNDDFKNELNDLMN